MTIVGVTRSDTPGNNVRTASGIHDTECAAETCQRPVRVTIRLDNNIPAPCLHHDSGPAETVCTTRTGHRHRRQTRSWQHLLGELCLGWGTTLRVTLVLIVLLGGLATIAIGIVGGLGASGPLLLANIGAIILQRRTATRARRDAD